MLSADPTADGGSIIASNVVDSLILICSSTPIPTIHAHRVGSEYSSHLPLKLTRRFHGIVLKCFLPN